MVHSRNYQKEGNDGSNITSDQIATQLAAIATKLDAIVSQMRGDVAEIKSVMFGTRLPCNNQDLVNEKIPDSKPSINEDRFEQVLDLQSKTEDLSKHVSDVQSKIEDQSLGVKLKIGGGISLQVRENLETKQNQIKIQAYLRHHELITFEVGDVDFPHQPHRCLEKLSSRFFGPNHIIPKTNQSRIHQVYCVAMLKYAWVRVPTTFLSSSPLIIQDWETDLQLHSVLNSRGVQKAGKPTTEWLIAWLSNRNESDNNMPCSMKWVNETYAATIEWMIAWQNYYRISDLRTSRFSGPEVLIRTCSDQRELKGSRKMKS